MVTGGEHCQLRAAIEVLVPYSRDFGGRGRSALPPPVAPHLRHEPVRRGEDIHVVQRLMGHSNIATTTRYLHLSDADLLEAIDRAFPDGRGAQTKRPLKPPGDDFKGRHSMRPSSRRHGTRRG